MFLIEVLMASTARPYDEGRSTSESTSSKNWKISCLFSLMSSDLKSATTLRFRA